MKPNKPLKEAIFRAPESTDENKQPQQEKLYHMGTTAKPKNETNPQKAQQDLVNEKPRNQMESLYNLRELEYEVVKEKKKM
ncbi:hypothetical protein [Pontibacter pudoricolor]|uniref:hypothetical protein n=1 Tax=Pontibacter pudoricolor TaxID=2694930 RepID=UPI0013919532|nr:hypothetical protein [Pontibacter pudoricolor]